MRARPGLMGDRPMRATEAPSLAATSCLASAQLIESLLFSAKTTVHRLLNDTRSSTGRINSSLLP
jgi:hypothetical protein